MVDRPGDVDVATSMVDGRHRDVEMSTSRCRRRDVDVVTSTLRGRRRFVFRFVEGQMTQLNRLLWSEAFVNA